MGRLRALEVLILSVIGPATLFVVFWFYPTGIPSTAGGGGEPPTGAASRSRTHTVRVYQGELAGFGPVRVFTGFTPGLDRGLPLAQARRRLGLAADEVPLTLLVLNRGEKNRPALGPEWSLSQEGNRPWAWRRPTGTAPATRLFTGAGADLPVARVARHLFSGKSRPAAASMLLSGPGGEVRLQPVDLPAQELWRFSADRKL